MKKELALKFVIKAIFHCPIWCCNHTEKSKDKMIEHLIKDHTDKDYYAEKKEDKIWNSY